MQNNINITVLTRNYFNLWWVIIGAVITSKSMRNNIKIIVLTSYYLKHRWIIIGAVITSNSFIVRYKI